MKQDNFDIKKYLFKPLIIQTEVGDKPIIIFSYSAVNEHVVGPKGNVSKKMKDMVKYLNIFQSMEVGFPIVESLWVEDKDKFEESVVEMLPQQYLSLIMNMTTIVAEEFAVLSEKIEDITNLLNAIKKSVDMAEDVDEGSLVLFGSEEPLSRIVFKTITGQKIDLKSTLSEEDISKIGAMLREVIQSHIDKDLESKDFLKRLQNEIEYKIVESLPDNLKAGDIQINLDAVVQEIKNFREMDIEDE